MTVQDSLCPQLMSTGTYWQRLALMMNLTHWDVVFYVYWDIHKECFCVIQFSSIQ